MFGRKSKLTRYENQQEKVTYNQEEKMVNNSRLRIATDNGIRRQEPLISQHKFYKRAQGIKRIYTYKRDSLLEMKYSSIWLNPRRQISELKTQQEKLSEEQKVQKNKQQQYPTEH